MEKSVFYLLLISLCIGCKISTEERIHQAKTLRDAKQAELKKLSESFKDVTAGNIEFIIKQLNPLRTTVDSLDRIIDSLEGNEKPHKRWRQPDPNGPDR